ncbi:MAG: hypothetical protein ACYCZA_08470 [Thiobacillus sp.]
MDLHANPLAPLPIDTSRSGIHAEKRQEGHQIAAAQGADDSNLNPGREMAHTLSNADTLFHRKGPGEQALYAVTVRRFLDVSRVYLALQYTGARHWYPNGGIFTESSDGSRCPAQRFKQGEKHVVG